MGKIENIRLKTEQLDDIPEQDVESVEPEEEDIPAVEVKKNFIEKICDRQYERRVARAMEKALKKETKPEKTETGHKKVNWKKIGIGAGVVLGAIVLGAVNVVGRDQISESSSTDSQVELGNDCNGDCCDCPNQTVDDSVGSEIQT